MCLSIGRAREITATAFCCVHIDAVELRDVRYITDSPYQTDSESMPSPVFRLLFLLGRRAAIGKLHTAHFPWRARVPASIPAGARACAFHPSGAVPRQECYAAANENRVEAACVQLESTCLTHLSATTTPTNARCRHSRGIVPAPTSNWEGSGLPIADYSQ